MQQKMASEIPLKILLVHNYYQIPGGEDTVVKNEKEMLENHGHKVIFYNRKNSEMKEFNLWQKFCLPFSAVYSFKTYKDIKRIIYKEQIDIVHVHNTVGLISPSVYYAAVTCRIPVVQTIHNFRLLCPGATLYQVKKEHGEICEDCITQGFLCALKHKCYRNSWMQTFTIVASLKIHRALGIYKKINYICLTEFNKNKLLESNFKGKTIVEPTNIYIKPNFTFIQSNPLPQDERKNQFIYVGRLDEIKGIHLLFEAWKKVTGSKLIVCGTGPEEHWCKNYISHNGISNIEMLGFRPNEEIKLIMAESKALIFPSQWYECFPMTIIEAWSVETPVLCGNIGNGGTLVEDGLNGLKFQFDDASDLAKKIKIIQEHNIQFDFKSVFSNCIEPTNYKLLSDIYHRLIASGGQ